MTIHYLLDVSWMLYRGYYALSHVYEEYPEIHFLCKKIESLLANKSAIIYMCLDGCSPKGRRLLGSDYKANRHQEDHYNVYAGLPSFIRLLHNDRVKIYYNDLYESDEIIFSLSKTLEGRKKILSGDKDLLQALSRDVSIDNGKDFVVTNESYKFEYEDKFFGIEPIKLPVFRAIVGDPSDSLKPPVARFPKKIAAKIVNGFKYKGNAPTKEELLTLSKNFTDTEMRWVEKLIEAYDSFYTNFDIMKLNVIEDSLDNEYEGQEVELSGFLKQKILRLNTL